MRKLIYYIAATLDGYIAGPDDQYDFFPFGGEESAAILADFPETMPTPAREPLGIADRAARRFDTVIMGSATYAPGLKLGWTSPYDIWLCGGRQAGGGPARRDRRIDHQAAPHRHRVRHPPVRWSLHPDELRPGHHANLRLRLHHHHLLEGAALGGRGELRDLRFGHVQTLRKREL
ncbi:hypothetical protein [Streptomyces sp. NPDC006463]|uniref:hypothetical protein n=1 Tax=Streptomyces sp. NPDC006463 TaxID=3364746 RepID=UPI003678846F